MPCASIPARRHAASAARAILAAPGGRPREREEGGPGARETDPEGARTEHRGDDSAAAANQRQAGGVDEAVLAEAPARAREVACRERRDERRE